MKDRLAWEFDKYQVFRYNLTWCGRGVDSSALMISSPGQSSAKERSCGNYGRDGQEEKRAGGTPHLPLQGSQNHQLAGTVHGAVFFLLKFIMETKLNISFKRSLI